MAARLATFALLILVVALPLAMVPASKSPPFLVVLAALVAGVAALVPGGRSVVARSEVALPIALAAALAAFVALAIASLGWAHDAKPGLRQLGEAAAPVLAVALLAWALPGRALSRVMLAGCLGVAAVAAVVAGDLALGLELRRRLGLRGDAHMYNRAMVVALLLLWPAAAAAVLHRQRWAAVLAAAALAAGIALAVSGSAVLGGALGLTMAGFATVFPRAALAALGLGWAVMLLAAPFQGSIMAALLNERWLKALASGHAAERIALWQAFEAALATRPWLGHGFGSTATLAAAPAVAGVGAALQPWLAIGHPHSVPLQLWVELGAAGAALAALVLALLWGLLARLDRRLLPFALGFAASATAVAVVSHGAWQPWWLAVLGVGAVLLAVIERDLSLGRV